MASVILLNTVLKKPGDTSAIQLDGPLILNGGMAVGGTASASALVEFTSTTKGIRLPRLTSTQRDAVSGAVSGLVIYNSTTNKINFYNGSSWQAVTSGAV